VKLFPYKWRQGDVSPPVRDREEATRKVAAALRNDPLRRHSGLSDEQLDLDARVFAAQIVDALLGQPDPEKKRRWPFRRKVSREMVDRALGCLLPDWGESGVTSFGLKASPSEWRSRMRKALRAVLSEQEGPV
jgi:hypothetical protein